MSRLGVKNWKGPPTCEHKERKQHAFGLCVLCYGALWRRNNPEKAKAMARRKWLTCKQTGAWRNTHLKTHFKITQADYDKLNTKQGGLCAICQKQCKSGRRLAVDHNHETEEIRGLLCMSCNRALGWIENEAWYDLARVYIGRNR